jgi:ABC-type multidrug transport system ATPase subunit
MHISNLNYKFEDQYGSFSIEIDGFNIDKGKFHFLHGNSGSGKTTFLNILSGVINTEIKEKVRNDFKTVAYVMHESTLPPWCTVNKCISIEESLRSKPIDKEFFLDICAQFKLNDDILSMRARHLSLGMRQRVELAKAISFEPDLLLLDEAFSGIDNKTKSTVLSTVSKLAKDKNITIIGTAHQVNDLLRIAEKIILIEEGCLLTETYIDESVHSRLLMTSHQLHAIDAAKVIMNNA